MSFAQSFKKFLPNAYDKNPSETKIDGTKSNGRFGNRRNPLLLLKTEDYVDDTALYQPKITRNDRLSYYEFLQSQKTQQKKFLWYKANQNSWVSKEIRMSSEESLYPSIFVNLFRLIRSNWWDQVYLNLFIVFLLLLVLLRDGWAELLLPSLVAMQDSILLYPLLGMLVCAGIPCLGTAYYTHYCNDLVLLRASIDFQQWVSFYHYYTAVIHFHLGDMLI
jgi:hypothetical protein